MWACCQWAPHLRSHSYAPGSSRIRSDRRAKRIRSGLHAPGPFLRQTAQLTRVAHRCTVSGATCHLGARGSRRHQKGSPRSPSTHLHAQTRPKRAARARKLGRNHSAQADRLMPTWETRMFADVHPHGHELRHVLVPIRRSIAFSVSVCFEGTPVQRIELQSVRHMCPSTRVRCTVRPFGYRGATATLGESRLEAKQRCDSPRP
jgi:hypothetical protein